ncbi:MAG: collagen-like protein [Candidatus Dojkabacteria bacterium]
MDKNEQKNIKYFQLASIIFSIIFFILVFQAIYPHYIFGVCDYTRWLTIPMVLFAILSFLTFLPNFIIRFKQRSQTKLFLVNLIFILLTVSILFISILSNLCGGSTGITGATGLNGTIGVSGNIGGTGEQGKPGSTGSKGISGQTGTQGNSGEAGAVGAGGTPGSVGSTGSNGIPGTNGLVGGLGLQGPPGPQGDPGAAGTPGTSANINYGYIYNTGAQSVAIDAPILFSSSGPMVGVTHTAGTSTITITNAGVYSINFSVSGAEANQFTVYINGTPSPTTTYGSAAGIQQNNGQAILILGAGDVLTVVNHSSAAAVTLTALVGGTQSTVSASVLIRRLD